MEILLFSIIFRCVSSSVLCEHRCVDSGARQVKMTKSKQTRQGQKSRNCLFPSYFILVSPRRSESTPGQYDDAWGRIGVSPAQIRRVLTKIDFELSAKRDGTMAERPRRTAQGNTIHSLLAASQPSAQTHASTSNSLGSLSIAAGNAEGGEALVERILGALSKEQRELALSTMNNIPFLGTSSPAVGTPGSGTPLTNGGYEELDSPFLPQSFSARPLPGSTTTNHGTTISNAIHYVPLPTRSGRIPHLPDQEGGIETRDSQLFNDYFDFPSDDEEDPDFLPVVDGVQRDWDDILIPGSYGSSEAEGEEGGRDEDTDDGGYVEFLAGFKAGPVEGLGITPSALRGPSTLESKLIPIACAPPSLPTPPLVIAPITLPKRYRRSLSPLPEEPPHASTSSSTPLAPPDKNRAASSSTAKPAPVKRIKLTPEESKARTAARSAAAGKVRLEKRRAAKAEYATRCVTLEAENEELKARIEVLESQLQGNGGKSTNLVQGKIEVAATYARRSCWMTTTETSGSEMDQDRYSLLEGDLTTGESADGAAISPIINPFRPHPSTSAPPPSTGTEGGEGIIMTREERQNVALLLQWASTSRLGLGISGSK